MIRKASSITPVDKQKAVAYWGVRCHCGGVIPLKVVPETTEQPPIDHEGAITVFCTRCGAIECLPNDVRKCHGFLPEDYWPRLDLFQSEGSA